MNKETTRPNSVGVIGEEFI